jgi:hypothetical protein
MVFITYLPYDKAVVAGKQNCVPIAACNGKWLGVYSQLLGSTRWKSRLRKFPPNPQETA